MIDADQRARKTDFSRNNSAQLSFDNFVDAQHAVFHGRRWSIGVMEFNISILHYSTLRLFHCLEFLRDRFKLIALDHVAYLIFTEVAELNSAFQTRTHFFYVILEAPQRRKTAVVNRLPFTKHAGTCGAGYPAIGNETPGHNTSAQLE